MPPRTTSSVGHRRPLSETPRVLTRATTRQSGPDGFLLRESDLYEEDGMTKLPDYDANIGVVIEEDFPAAR